MLRCLIISFLVLVHFCGCQRAEVYNSADNSANASPASYLQRDTSPPAAKQERIIVESPRPKKEIDSRFPFDISLKMADENRFSSTNVLAPDGKPVVLLFWLTTCYPCRLEMTAIAKEYERWQQEADFKLVAISTDFPQNYSKFADRVQKSNWPWETYLDIRREFRYVLPGGLNGLPQTFVFNPKGEIVYHKRKYSPGDEHALFEQIKAAAL